MPRRPRVRTHAGGRSSKRMACRTREADGNALQLSGTKRHAHVGAGQPRLLVLDSVAAGQMQARGGGPDEVEWCVDLRVLGGQNAAAHALGEEAVVILEGKQRWLWPWGRLMLLLFLLFLFLILLWILNSVASLSDTRLVPNEPAAASASSSATSRVAASV